MPLRGAVRGGRAERAALGAADRLAEIPGVTRKLTAAIIAETGLDMTRFPTAGHLVSWAGLAPVTRQSGPRSRKPGKGQGDAYLKGYCTQAATGAADPSARFTDLGAGWHNTRADHDRKIRAHLRQLQALGLEVTITAT
jgi:hypothetical protein